MVSLLFPRLPALLALGIGEGNLGLRECLIRPLGSSVLLRTRVMVCNAFSPHNVDELRNGIGQILLNFMEGVPLLPARTP